MRRLKVVLLFVIPILIVIGLALYLGFMGHTSFVCNTFVGRGNSAKCGLLDQIDQKTQSGYELKSKDYLGMLENSTNTAGGVTFLFSTLANNGGTVSEKVWFPARVDGQIVLDKKRSIELTKTNDVDYLSIKTGDFAKYVANGMSVILTFPVAIVTDKELFSSIPNYANVTKTSLFKCASVNSSFLDYLQSQTTYGYIKLRLLEIFKGCLPNASQLTYYGK